MCLVFSGEQLTHKIGFIVFGAADAAGQVACIDCWPSLSIVCVLVFFVAEFIGI